MITAAILLLLGLIPGMPNLVFLLLGGAVAGLAYMIARRQTEPQAEPAAAPLHPVSDDGGEMRELTWQDIQPVDVVGLEVGYRLIPLVDREQGGQLMNRIKGVRKKLTQDLGFLIPSVHIRDNLDLNPNAYRISLNGVAVAEFDVFVDREMAINPGRVFGELKGEPTTDPAFGLDALWIDSAMRDQAQTMGYTVVDASTVVATHLSEVLHSHAHELLGHEEVQKLMDTLGQSAPKLVEDLVPKLLPLSVVLRVLQNLLQEGVPIRDLRTIAETLAEHASGTQDAGLLTAAVRVALARSIVQQVVGPSGEIPVVVLEPGLERLLQQTLASAGEDAAGVEPGMLEQLQQALQDTARQQELSGQDTVLLVAAGIRPWLAKFARHSVPGIRVLSYNEIPDNRQIKVVSTIGRNSGQS
jgi:flagellar biosynthesis protein FlhA